MKKKLLLTTGLVPLFLAAPVFADTVTVNTNAPTVLTLKLDGKVLDQKEIDGEGEFELPDGDVGRYIYEITDGTNVYTIEQYIVYRGDVKESSFISYLNNEKQQEIYFDNVESESGSVPTVSESKSQAPPPTSSDSKENINPSESAETGTTATGTTPPPPETVTETDGSSSKKGGNVNTGDTNNTALYIIVSAAAGAGIGVTVYFIRRNKKGGK